MCLPFVFFFMYGLEHFEYLFTHEAIFLHYVSHLPDTIALSREMLTPFRVDFIPLES